jgi:hypothetical protein
MTRQSSLLLIGVAFVLVLLALGAGAWWYLFGANEIESADLVPANTLFFASIPNAATLLEGYQSSQAKTLLASTNVKPLQDSVVNLIGQKNLDLIYDFLPNLSGQSFVAITHFDSDHPEKVGLIAAMKPKAGLGDFATFLDKVKAAWPDVIKQGKTGTATVEGVDYQWIQGPGSPDKVCVAQLGGWIVTSWGEASLQDWIERYRGKSDTSSLAKDLNYEKSLVRVGDNPMTVLYVNLHVLVDLLQKQVEKTDPAQGDYLSKKLADVGGLAIGTRFENGEIVDRFSFLFPRPAQIDSGMGVDPCPFDTLKFTGPDTRFYWASTMNWKQYARNLRDQAHQSGAVNPMAANGVTFLQNWTRGAGLDGEHNIVEALGSEVSVQAEWTADGTYPEVGLFVKVDKPDDFKPTITAIINSVRQAYANTAVVKELAEGDQHFAALQFVQPSSISPTITEDGPYFGIFLTEGQAVRSFQRDPSIGLTHNADFNRQVGDKRNGATQVLFLDSPYLLDRAYRTAMPYLSIAEMFNKTLAGLLAGKNLPPDLSWLAPIGTWSCVTTPDEEGIQGYSVSGIGNQGILLSGAIGGAAGVLQTMGLLPKPAGMPGSVFLPGTPPVPSPLMPMGAAPTLNNSPSSISVAPFPALPPPPVMSNPAAADEAGSVIYITQADKLFFDQTPVPADQISDFLKARKAANQALKLAVKVDRNASPDILSTVMDAGASAGFGVLPYAYTSGADSMPPVPATNSAPAAAGPTSPVTATNAGTASAPSMNPAPILPPNADGSPPIPAPLQPQ